MTTPATPVMTLRSVSFAYESQPVLQDVSATLAAGRVTALIGPNASGKSTLMQLMLGQLSPTGGRVLLGEQRVGAIAASRRAGWISYVPQRGMAAFDFTVEEVVAMGRHALTRSPQAVADAMASCELETLRARTYSHLSVGQQQRVLLARAMAQASGAGRVMLLDEPGSAMDLWHAHRTMQRLRHLAAGGLAVLVVVHDLNLAAQYADEVWLLHEGQLVKVGPWDQVLHAEILQPVYRVAMTPLKRPGHDRPTFVIDATSPA